MNKLVTKKILGFKDPTQTFVINIKQSDTNREITIQIVDELTLFDFSDITTAILYYDNHILDLTNCINKENSSITFSMNEIAFNTVGDLHCEIVLKDKNGNNILITNKFLIRIKSLGGGCDC
jgi:hypothetical protein